MRLRIVGARQPHLPAAVARRVEALPRLDPGIAGIHRHRIELPLQRARLGIERLQESRRVEIVAGADQHVIPDHHRRRRREILLREARDLLVPPLAARARVERHEVVVGRLHVEIGVPEGEPAVADVRAALRLPEVVPDLVAVLRVDRPRVIGRRDVQHAVHGENRPLHAQRVGDDDVARALAADRERRRRGAASPCACASAAAPPAAGARRARQPAHPRERQVLHVRLVDLRQRAVALAGVVAGVRGPVLGERLEELRRVQAVTRGERDTNKRRSDDERAPRPT